MRADTSFLIFYSIYVSNWAESTMKMVFHALTLTKIECDVQYLDSFRLLLRYFQLWKNMGSEEEYLDFHSLLTLAPTTIHLFTNLYSLLLSKWRFDVVCGRYHWSKIPLPTAWLHLWCVKSSDICHGHVVFVYFLFCFIFRFVVPGIFGLFGIR